MHVTGRNFTRDPESEPQRNLGDENFSLPDQKMQGDPRRAGKVCHVSIGGTQGKHDEGWERRRVPCNNDGVNPHRGVRGSFFMKVTSKLNSEWRIGVFQVK